MYKIVQIDEEDFGCEGRLEGQIPMVKVFLEGEDGCEEILMMEDAEMYRRELDVGDFVEIGDDGTIYNPEMIIAKEEIVKQQSVIEEQASWMEGYLDAVEEME